MKTKPAQERSKERKEIQEEMLKGIIFTKK